MHRIQPILYERIDILGSSVVPSLLQAITTKDRAFLDSTVRALMVSGDLNLRCAKLIFDACSRSIVSFSAWCNTENPSIYLPFIHSPYLRRLVLILNTPAGKDHESDGSFNIPTGMLTMLTHVVVLSYSSTIATWDDLERASSAPTASLAATPTTLASFDAFQNLTHIAVGRKAWPYISQIRKVAKKLCYFAILTIGNSLLYRIVIQEVRSLNDRRFVVVNRKHFWEGDSRCVTTFWETVETLVSSGFISDRGHRWPMEYEKA